MAKPEFTSVLDMPLDEAERPKQLPPGGYVCIIKNRYTQDKSRERETPFFEWQLHPVEALENVNPSWLEEALTRKDGSKKQLSDMIIRARFWDTEDAAYRLRKFLLVDCQIPNEGSTEQIMEAATGCQVVANIKHRMVGDDAYINLESTAPVNPPEKTKKAASRR